MDMQQRNGYFVISDISGYTAFMVGTELEHAHHILQELLNAILDSIQPPLLISNYQGDAILSYAPDDAVLHGQTLHEMVDAIYINFIKARERMRLNTICTCRACSNIPALDLKLFIHYGAYITYMMRGKEELSGPDVILAHRIMKNRVRENLGLQAYALYTDAALQSMNVPLLTESCQVYSDEYEHFGEVRGRAYDLSAMWESQRHEHRLVVPPEEAFFDESITVRATPAQVWDVINAPETKGKMRAAKISGINLTAGKMGAGTSYHCDHGATKSTHSIVCWEPFAAVSETITMPLQGVMMGSTLIEPINDYDTRVTYRLKVLPTDRAMTDRFYKTAHKLVTTIAAAQARGDLNRLRKLVEERRARGTIADRVFLGGEIDESLFARLAPSAAPTHS